MQLKVTNQKICPLDIEQIVSGSVNLYDAYFDFSEDWDGFEKTAVFLRVGNEDPVPRLIDQDNHCKVPYTEVLEKGGYILIGVSGVKGTDDDFVRKPTVWTEAIELEVGCIDGHIVPDPDPEIYEELLLRIAKVEREIQGLNGGETGEVLTKLSDDDDDYGWRKTTRSVNNKQGDVVLDAEDVDAVPEDNYLTNIEIEEIINSVA